MDEASFLYKFQEGRKENKNKAPYEKASSHIISYNKISQYKTHKD